MLLAEEGDINGMTGGFKKLGDLPMIGIPFGRFIGGGNIVPGKFIGLCIDIGIGGIEKGLGIN